MWEPFWPRDLANTSLGNYQAQVKWRLYFAMLALTPRHYLAWQLLGASHVTSGAYISPFWRRHKSGAVGAHALRAKSVGKAPHTFSARRNRGAVANIAWRAWSAIRATVLCYLVSTMTFSMPRDWPLSDIWKKPFLCGWSTETCWWLPTKTRETLVGGHKNVYPSNGGS